MRLEDLIKLSNEDNDAAYEYYKTNNEKVLGMFNSAENLLKYFNETERDTTLTFKMIVENPKYFVNLIKSPNEAFSLLKANDLYATILFLKGTAILRPLFSHVDDIIRLALLDSQCAGYMLAAYNDYPKLKQYRTSLFSDARINDLFFELAADKNQGNFILTILRFIPEKNIDPDQLNRLAEIMKANPSIKNNDVNEIITNNLEEYIRLTNRGSMEAADLLSKNPKKVLGFFETVEDFLSFNERTGKTYTSLKLVMDHQKLISGLFKSHDDFFSFVKISKRDAFTLLGNTNYDIRSLFKTSDQLIQLAFLSTKCADEILLCGKDMKDIDQYHKEIFKDARISDLLLQLAGEVPNGRFVLNIARCIPKKNIDINRANNLLNILTNNPSIDNNEVEQLRQFFSNSNSGIFRFFQDVSDAIDTFTQEVGVIFGNK